MKKKLYIETSVWNQLEQDERPDWREIAEQFFISVEKGLYEIFISDVVVWEILGCNENKRREYLFSQIKKYDPVRLDYSEEVQTLHQKYIEARIMNEEKKNQFYDMAHVAVSTVYGINNLLSFNFLRINHFRKCPRKRCKISKTCNSFLFKKCMRLSY